MDGSMQNSKDEPPPRLSSTVSTGTTPVVAANNNFSTTISNVVNLVLEIFEKEIEQKQLYYHGLEHVNGVARRAELILETVTPFYQQGGSEQENGRSVGKAVDWERQHCLLHLSAIAHDMLQIFSPNDSPHTSRRREAGESEKVTVKRLLDLIKEVQPTIHQSSANQNTAHFTHLDIEFLREAIEATICEYDSENETIYQPWLYPEHRNGRPIALIARCLALADIGTLGIEGLKAYTHEGMLLLLEENPDIVAFLQSPETFDPSLSENFRLRLLKRARFEVTFAKGRLERIDQELDGLPTDAIKALKQNVFKHLTPTTIQTLEAVTPTADNTPLVKLLDYFQLEHTQLEQTLK